MNIFNYGLDANILNISITLSFLGITFLIMLVFLLIMMGNYQDTVEKLNYKIARLTVQHSMNHLFHRESLNYQRTTNQTINQLFFDLEELKNEVQNYVINQGMDKNTELGLLSLIFSTGIIEKVNDYSYSFIDYSYFYSYHMISENTLFEVDEYDEYEFYDYYIDLISN